MRLFRNPWDAIPAGLALLHFAALIAFFVAWPHLTWLERVGGGGAYAFSIGWSLDSIAHNFIHNPFFVWARLNTAMSFVLSWTLGISQVMYTHIHWRHHAGNSDRPDDKGETIDPISVYRFGEDGKAEPMGSYVIQAFLRDDDPFTLARQIGKTRPGLARQALAEFWTLMAFWLVLLALNWQFILVMAPFYYLGQSFSALIAYYEHAGADPDRPSATGVSTYAPVYNWMFLNNGYHAEHHYRPKQHWTMMKALQRDLEARGLMDQTHIIRTAHFLGFLDPASKVIPTARKAPAAR